MKYIKFLITTMSLISICTFNSLSAEAAWTRDSKGWWNSENSSWSVGWRNIDNKWYYFGLDGYMKTGWIQDKDKWYYLGPTGAMIKDDTINGYYLGEDGAWIEDYLKDTDNTDDVTIKTEKEVYDLKTEDIDVYIKNNSSTDQGFGEHFQVEKLEDNKWSTLEFSDTAFDEPYFLISPYTTLCKTYRLSRIKDFTELTAGKYRIVIHIGGINRTAEFKLQ